MEIRKLPGALFGAALLVAAGGFAQTATSPQRGDEDPVPKVSTPSTSSTDTNSAGSAATATTGTATSAGTASAETPKSGSSGPATSSTAHGAARGTAPRTYTGTVKTFNAGHTLVVTTSSGKVRTFDIRNSPTIDSSVAAGSRVRVRKTVDANGHTVVTVEPYR